MKPNAQPIDTQNSLEADRRLVAETLLPQAERGDLIRFVRTGLPPGAPPTMPEGVSRGDWLRDYWDRLMSTTKAEELLAMQERRLRVQLGLRDAKTLPRHDRLLAELVKLCPPKPVSRPLNSLTRDNAERARELVAQLPQTAPAREFLREGRTSTTTFHV